MMSLKSISKVVLILASLFCSYSNVYASKWKVPSRKAKVKNPVVPNKKSLRKGRQLYVAECQECHGATGKGDGPKSGELKVEVKDLNSPELFKQSDGALFWKITVGKRPMPSYKKLIGSTERWHVVNYMRSLKGK